MRTESLPLSKFSKDSQPFATLTIAVVSERDLTKSTTFGVLPDALRERVEAARERAHEPLKAGVRMTVSGRAKGEEDFWLVVLPEPAEMHTLLEFARDTLKAALHPTLTEYRLVLLSKQQTTQTADAFGAATAARIFPMPVFGQRVEQEKPWKLAQVSLVTAERKALESFAYGFATGEGTNLARYLATLPPNILNPATYGERIRKLAREHGLTLKVHTKAELKKMGAGAFTAVDQGNPDSAGGIYELTYAPKGVKPKKQIHLAGKGMCFDTGGYDVKVGGNMLTMKGDMQGSAIALATILTAARLKAPYAMKAFLAITENHISPVAYKPDEVITALNGLTIEIVNTDAEGRMVLADTLTLASRGKPDCVIDFATLTGSAVRSIGTKYCAGFTNREKLHEPIKAAGRASGERVWTFPIDATFEKALKSKVADTLQCVKGPGPDHILASCFLSKFVQKDVPWVHIDLSASENEGGINHVDSMFTGFGVRWALEFIDGL